MTEESILNVVDEDTIIYKGETYKAVETDEGIACCKDCAFVGKVCSGLTVPCSAHTRKDKLNVIWMLEEKKDVRIGDIYEGRSGEKRMVHGFTTHHKVIMENLKTGAVHAVSKEKDPGAFLKLLERKNPDSRICISELAECEDELLLAELVRRNKASDAPAQTERYGKHLESIIGIGKDHTASIIMTDEAAKELPEVLPF